MTEKEITAVLGKVLKRVQERRIFNRFLAGAIKKLKEDVVACL